MIKLNIPLKRPLYPPDSGKKTPDGEDILAIKRVISRAGFWPWGQFDDTYSNRFAHGVKNRLGLSVKGSEGVAGFQKYLGIKATGNWGDTTHKASLAFRVPKGLPNAGQFVWDQTAINLYKGYEDLTPAQETVAEIFTWWDWMVTNERQWHYDMGRPITTLLLGKKPPVLPRSEDCSGTFLIAAWLAGAKSPDRTYGYSGYGNTDSMVDDGFEISESDIDKYAKSYYIGAFYGRSRWSTKHMVAVKNRYTIYSHGHEAGPEKLSNLHYHSYPLVAIRAYSVI